MADLSNITIEYVRSIISYDPGTGQFTWLPRYPSELAWNYAFAGKRAGSLDGRGYRKIKLLGISIKEHRLAWFYQNGVWPDGQIDHINRDKADNRLSNLRVVTNSENMRNMPLKRLNPQTLGVNYHRRDNRFRAVITVNKVIIHLGGFKTFEEAREARVAAEIKYFGQPSPVDYRKLRKAKAS
jgi:hypothetical protein